MNTSDVLDKARADYVAVSGNQNPPLRSVIWHAVQEATKLIGYELDVEGRKSVMTARKGDWPIMRKEARLVGLNEGAAVVLDWIHAAVCSRNQSHTVRHKLVLFAFAQNRSVNEIRKLDPDKGDSAFYSIRNRCLRQIEDWIIKHGDAPAISGVGIEEIEKVEGVRDISFLADRLRGVYFLFRGGRLFYVGQSRDIVARLLSHAKGGAGVFDRAFFVPVPLDRLDEVEKEMIGRYNPERNIMRPVY